MTRVGLVTIASGRHDHLLGQHESLARSRRRPDSYVVASMEDPALRPRTVEGLDREVVAADTSPLGLCLAAARNRGAEAALAQGADVLVFLDVDCLAGPDLVAAYADAVTAQPDVVWSGPVTYLDPPPLGGYPLDRLDELDAPHRARPDPGRGRTAVGTDPNLFWSLSFALAAEAWERIGGFCEEYVGYGGEDTDFGQTVVTAGLQHGTCGSARAYHQWHPVSSPPVEHLEDVLRNAELFRRRWGRPCMEGWLAAFADLGLVERAGETWRRVPART